MKEPARIADFQQLAPYQPVIEEPGQVLLDAFATTDDCFETFNLRNYAIHKYKPIQWSVQEVMRL